MSTPTARSNKDGNGARPLTVQAAITASEPARRPTISDVAKLCGVTPATVSRVLNKKKEFSTTDAVRDKIWNIARQVGYVPDLSARNLSRQNTYIIGLFSSPQTHVAEGIYESLLEGIASVLHAAGYEIFFELSPIHSKNPLPFWRFDGAILMQSPKIETVMELDRRHVPYVCVNERVGRPAAYVVADDAMGMHSAIEHLVSLGHKRIAYANAGPAYFSHYSVIERYETLLAAARAGTIQLVPGHDTPFPSPQDFLRRAVVEGGATAIITYDHRIASMILGSAYQLGMKVPDDFSLICFNDVFPVAMLHPPLTCIAVAGREIGRLGAEVLMQCIKRSRAGATKEIRVAENLIVRKSTAAPQARS